MNVYLIAVVVFLTKKLYLHSIPGLKKDTGAKNVSLEGVGVASF